MKAVILAAGKGERLVPLTDGMPKVMLPVANRPLLEYGLEAVSGFVDEIIIVTGYMEEAVRKRFGGEFRGVRLRYVTQKKQLGTGHALQQAEKHIDGRFILMMGDHIHPRSDIEKCLKQDLCMLLQRVPDLSGFGAVATDGGRVAGITEKPKRPAPGLANAALYVLDQRIFDFGMGKSERGEYEITEALQKLCARHRLGWAETTEWRQLTYPWDLLALNEEVLKRTGPAISETAKISGRARIEGPVAVGDGAELKDCVIRPYTAIGDGAVIGNFVEVKNSVIMEGTRIPHLSYIGDSVIGCRCNLGAGTKAANLRFDDGPVSMMVGGKRVSTGRRKMGCVMGHDAKTGINVSILPGAVIESGKRVNPGTVYK